MARPVSEMAATSVPLATAIVVLAADRRNPVSVSDPHVMPGAAAVPEAAFICPVMDACPSRGRELVSSEATSVKFAFIELDEIVLPEENEFVTVIVPEPLRGIIFSPLRHVL
jgi:hypothetical protein